MEKISFKDFNLDITLTSFTNIVGTMGSGKTTILKMLINKFDHANILIDGKRINEYSIDYLKRSIAAVLNNFDFKTEYVKEELLYYQEQVHIDYELAYKNIDKFTKFFGLEELIDSKIELLTVYEKAYIKILSLLIINPEVFGIDDMLTYLSLPEKLKIIKYAKANNIKIINVTSNSEELLLGTDIIIIDNGIVLAYEETDTILSNDKYLSKIGMNDPFIVELSTNLNYYDMLKKKYFDMKSLVGELWK